MKKKFSIALCIVLLFTMSISGVTSASNIEPVNNLTDTKVEQLKGLGFSEDQILSMPADVYNSKFQDLKGEVISQVETISKFDGNGNETVYFSKEEAYNAMFQQYLTPFSGGSNSHNDSWISKTMTVSDLGSKQYLLKYDFRWLNAFWFALKDAVAITHPESLSPIANSEIMVYSYDNPHNGQTISNYYWTAQEQKPFGYGFQFDLVGDILGDGTVQNRGYMSYRVKATPDSYVGFANAYGHYAHKTLSLTTGFGLIPGGLNVTPSSAWNKATDVNAQFRIE
ncbi:hypothetical protein C173_14590 [Paenibacillus sp. FSL R7-277]|uniref:hypothetical protein n=1 Tax=Paenibacillus sp. FSL R7-277 TaxID=1227352 RepID=UPI0003E2BA4C|nr:hypothetical protein [Paenibacillus sp. FSL R7-277]ETT72275.1 hypothetical protein C173_14590 [Paenibacillus sp. FSL R7-277]